MHAQSKANADLVVQLTQCNASMFPAEPKLNFAGEKLGKVELNVVGLLAKLLDARLSLVCFHGLTEALVRH